MKVIAQRVKQASVSVDNEVVGHIGAGLLLLVGFTHTDTLDTVSEMVHKVLHLRIFDDANGVMNESLLDQRLEVLSISQFTLYANTKKGNRPSYIDAAKPEIASEYYAAFNQLLGNYVSLAQGMFGKNMQINAHLDGPVTIELQKN